MRTADRIINELARSQGGVVIRRQLRARSVSVSEIRTRVGNGRLVPLDRGAAFVVGGAPVTDRTALQAAVLLLPGAAASHDSAARLLQAHAAPLHSGHHVTTDLGSSHRAGGVIVHRSSDLNEARVVIIDGIRCTDIDRTLVDLGAIWTRVRLTQSMEQSIVTGLTSLTRVHAELDRVARPGRHGVEMVRLILQELGSRTIGIESPLELDFDRVVQASDLPRPVRQWSPPCGASLIERVDAAFVAARLIVEVDGRTWHERREQLTRDRLRDQLAVANGWVVLRFDASQIRRDPESVIATLRATLEIRTAV